jgi:hypothetical protein
MMTFEEKVRTFNVLYELYRSPSNTSVFKGVPIEQRERVLQYYKAMGTKVKLRYRGPRAHRTFRSQNTRQSTCLQADATTFAVYFR